MSSRDSHLWLERIASLLGQQRTVRGKRATRILAGERLERRLVLCTTPVVEEAASAGASLGDEAACDQEMGPVTAAEYDQIANAAAVVDAGALAPEDPSVADHFFDNYAGEGEGEGEGEGSGSGSGSGGSAPSVSVGCSVEGEELVISGSVSDPDGMEGVSFSLGGLASGSPSLDEYGNFEIRMAIPEGPGTITISASDPQGHSASGSTEFMP